MLPTLKKLVGNRHLVLALWALALSLLLLYAALRWGTGSSTRYPGATDHE